MKNYTDNNLLDVSPASVPTGTLAIKVGNNVFLAGGGGQTSFYKCASVNTSNHTWTGYKAVLDSTTGAWSFAQTATSGLTFTNLTPFVGKLYTVSGGYLFEIDTPWIPLDGLLCSAFPDPNWVSGNSVSQWGDFAQSDVSKQPQLATIDGIVGIKARGGDEMACTTTAPTGDFSFLAKIYINDLSGAALNLLKFNSWLGAIIGFEPISDDFFLLSKQGVDATVLSVTKKSLGPGMHDIAVTYSVSDGAAKFYFNGNLYQTNTYYPEDGFDYSGNFYYIPVGTSDNLVLGLAAYNRVLDAAEIAGITW